MQTKSLLKWINCIRSSLCLSTEINVQLPWGEHICAHTNTCTYQEQLFIAVFVHRLPFQHAFKNAQCIQK